MEEVSFFSGRGYTNPTQNCYKGFLNFIFVNYLIE